MGFAARIICTLILAHLVLADWLNHQIDQVEKPEVVLVSYDNTKGYLNWMQDWFQSNARTNCSTKCVISEKKQDLMRADMVIFHAPTHGRESPRLPRKTPAHTLYLLFSMEQPKYAQILTDLNGLARDFDVLSTYSLESTYPGTNIPNIPVTYYPLNIVPIKAVMAPPKPFEEKNGFNTGVIATIFTSNCHNAGATTRFEYIKRLMELLPVHSYGKCHNNRQEPVMPEDPKWPPIAQKRARKVKILSNYKFYFAFENMPIQDYVSEKIFEALFAGTIPVYRGAKSIWKFMPSNDSFIDANDMSPDELVSLLTKLSNDETEYNKYFEFKKRPLTDSFKRIGRMSFTHPNVLCRYCEYALKEKMKSKA